MTKILLIVVACGILTGCAHPSWQPYVGPQQDWPVSPGSFIEPHTVIPVFETYPPKRYIILGRIRLWTQSGINLRAAAAEEAKARGADAVIVNSGQSFAAGSVGFGSATTSVRGNTATTFAGGFSAPIMQTELSAIAIKWRNPEDAAGFKVSDPYKPTQPLAPNQRQ